MVEYFLPLRITERVNNLLEYRRKIIKEVLKSNRHRG